MLRAVVWSGVLVGDPHLPSITKMLWHSAFCKEWPLCLLSRVETALVTPRQSTSCSALTHRLLQRVSQVFGCVKNTVVVWCGVLMGDRIDAVQIMGYGISVLGFALYTYAKMQPVGDALPAVPLVKKNR